MGWVQRERQAAGHIPLLAGAGDRNPFSTPRRSQAAIAFMRARERRIPTSTKAKSLWHRFQTRIGPLLRLQFLHLHNCIASRRIWLQRRPRLTHGRLQALRASPFAAASEANIPQIAVCSRRTEGVPRQKSLAAQPGATPAQMPAVACRRCALLFSQPHPKQTSRKSPFATAAQRAFPAKKASPPNLARPRRKCPLSLAGAARFSFRSRIRSKYPANRRLQPPHRGRSPPKKASPPIFPAWRENTKGPELLLRPLSVNLSRPRPLRKSASTAMCPRFRRSHSVPVDSRPPDGCGSPG